MTQANDGLSTADENGTPTRRAALSLIAAAVPVVAATSAVAMSPDLNCGVGRSEIARLFVEWQGGKRRHEEAGNNLSDADYRADALYPIRPDVLLKINAPERWQSRIWRPASIPEFARPEEEISLEFAKSLAAGKYGCPDAWTAEVLEAAERHYAARDAVDEISGRKACDAEWDRTFNAVRGIAKKIVSQVPTSLADVQMQLVAVKDQHEDEQVGFLEEPLFASILAASSAFHGRSV